MGPTIFPSLIIFQIIGPLADFGYLADNLEGVLAGPNLCLSLALLQAARGSWGGGPLLLSPPWLYTFHFRTSPWAPGFPRWKLISF